MLYAVVGTEHLREMCETWVVAVYIDPVKAETHTKKLNEEFAEHAAEAAKGPTTRRFLDSDRKQDVGLWNSSGDRRYFVDEAPLADEPQEKENT